MASNLRVDTILPSQGTTLGIGTAGGTINFLGNSNLTTSGDVTIGGNLGVGGTITYEDVARIDATGISTFREGFGVGPLTGIALTAYKDGSIRTSGIITATSYYGSGANLTGIDATAIQTGNTVVQTNTSRIDAKIANVGILTLTSSGIDVTGVVTATTFKGAFSGDGSALTGVGVGTADSINTSGIITATAFIPSVGNLGGRNLLINGDCQINQRHGVGGNVTGLTNGAAQFGADRWELKITNPSGGTWAFNHTDTSYEPGGFRRSIQCALTGTAQATPHADTFIYIRQKIEARNVVRLAYGNAAKKSVTLSFWMNCNVAGNGQVNLIHGDANEWVSGVYTYSNAGSWQKQTITFPGSDSEINNDNGLGFWVEFVIVAGANAKTGAVRTTWTTTSTGDRGAGQTMNIGATVGHKCAFTGIQLEEGSVATPYEHHSYGEELARCQRYYEGMYMNAGTAMFQGSSSINGKTENVIFAVEKRAQATWSLEGNSSWTGTTPNVFTSKNSALFHHGSTEFSLGDSSQDLCGSFSAEI